MNRCAVKSLLSAVRPVAVAAVLLALAGCASYSGGKVVDGTNLEVGMTVPGTEWSINFLSYTGGAIVKGNNQTRISVTNEVCETNSYCGVVEIKRHTKLYASIEPCEDEVRPDSSSGDGSKGSVPVPLMPYNPSYIVPLCVKDAGVREDGEAK